MSATNTIKVGDTVKRVVAGGAVLMQLKVTAVTEDKIICGPWQFDRETGAEIDDVLQWGPKYRATGSFIKKEG